MLLVEQKLPTLPEHLSSSSVFNGVHVARSLVFCVVLCRSLFVLLSFLAHLAKGHASICHHLIRTLQGTFLPSMVPIHPVVLEKKFVLHISHRVAMLNYVPHWWPSWIFNRSKK
jgi:hypothetical protein